MLPGPKRLIALRGTMVSAFVLTAEPVEAVPLPVLPMEFSARLRAASPATVATVEVLGALVGPETVPATALVAWVPPTEPPDLLTKTFLSVSELSQYFGATSMIT